MTVTFPCFYFWQLPYSYFCLVVMVSSIRLYTLRSRMSPLILGLPAWGTATGSCWLAEEMVPLGLPLPSLIWHSMARHQHCSWTVSLASCSFPSLNYSWSCVSVPADSVGGNALFGSTVGLWPAMTVQAHSRQPLFFDILAGVSYFLTSYFFQSNATGGAIQTQKDILTLLLLTAMCSIICLLTVLDSLPPFWFEHLFIFTDFSTGFTVLTYRNHSFLWFICFQCLFLWSLIPNTVKKVLVYIKVFSSKFCSEQNCHIGFVIHLFSLPFILFRKYLPFKKGVFLHLKKYQG